MAKQKKKSVWKKVVRPNEVPYWELQRDPSWTIVYQHPGGKRVAGSKQQDRFYVLYQNWLVVNRFATLAQAKKQAESA